MELSGKEYKEKLKRKFDKSGLKEFQAEEVLELALFYCMPQDKVREAARRLINRYGNVKSVFLASYESLSSLPFMSENSAAFIKLIPSLCAQYSECKAKSEQMSIDNIVKYLKTLYFGVDCEEVRLLCLDKDMHIINSKIIGKGDSSSSVVNINFLLSETLMSGCKACIIAHNHPNSSCVPSAQDDIITQKICRLLEPMDIKLIDHMIIGNDGIWSCSANSML